MPPGVTAVGLLSKGVDNCHEFIHRHLCKVVVVDNGAALGCGTTNYVAAGWVLVAGTVETVGEVDVVSMIRCPKRGQDLVRCEAVAVGET